MEFPKTLEIKLLLFADTFPVPTKVVVVVSRANESVFVYNKVIFFLNIMVKN